MSDWIKRKAIEFDANGLQILRGPGVYMFVKNDHAIYIGSAHKVIGRALARNHHKRDRFLENMSLMIFPCTDLAEAQALEKQLISDLKPLLNERNLRPIEQLAKLLGITNQYARLIASCQPIPSE